METGHPDRVAPRKEVHLPILCASEAQRGSACMVNVSISGALLAPASIQPARGKLVKVQFLDRGAGSDVVGTVVRHTDTGFAIQFLAVDSMIQGLVGEAA